MDRALQEMHSVESMSESAITTNEASQEMGRHPSPETLQETGRTR
jgi:hypothetical protein